MIYRNIHAFALLAIATPLILSVAVAASEAANLDNFYIQRLSEWKLRHQLWAALHFVIGVLSIFLSVAAAACPFKTEGRRRVVGYGAAVCAALQTFLSPTSQSRAYKQAWAGLDAAYQDRLRGDPNAAQAMALATKKGQELLDAAGPW